MTTQTIIHAFQITDIPELHDRIIAGAAVELGIPITNDPEIAASTFVPSILE